VRYRAFGATRFTSGATPTTFRYTGQREESSLGLYYYGARWYDPALGHFIQPDTIIPDAGNALDYHRYGYARFNSLKYTDPSGHCGMSVTAGEAWSGPYGEACMGFSAGLSGGQKAALSGGGGLGMAAALLTGLATDSPPSQPDPLPSPLESVTGQTSGASSTSFPLADGGPQTSIPASTGVFNNTLNVLAEPLPVVDPTGHIYLSNREREIVSLQRSIRSLEKQLTAHQEKLAEYIIRLLATFDIATALCSNSKFANRPGVDDADRADCG
jgi:RHS repeat-associated protein